RFRLFTAVDGIAEDAIHQVAERCRARARGGRTRGGFAGRLQRHGARQRYWTDRHVLPHKLDYTLTRSVSEGFAKNPRLRFGLVCDLISNFRYWPLSSVNVCSNC